MPTLQQILATAPAETQKEFRGTPVIIEWEKGSTREGKDKNGKPWKREMLCDYGFIPDAVTKGDGEPLDVYVGPNEEAPHAYVVEQLKEDGSLDEYKTMLGFNSLEEAEDMYLAHYPEGWSESHIGEIFEIPVDELLNKAEEARENCTETKEAAVEWPDSAKDNAAMQQALKNLFPGKKVEELDMGQLSQIMQEAQRLKSSMR